MQTNDDLALDEMDRIDRFHKGDPEAWHFEAEALLLKCMFLDLRADTKNKLVEWFKKGKKWLA